MSHPLGASIAALAVFSAVAASARPVSVPFDFSRNEVAIEATVNGAPVRLLLDTGVNPSVIDGARAKSLGLSVEPATAGDLSGTGTTKQATAFPTTIRGLEIAGDSAAPFEALGADLTDLSADYGARLDGVLGYSFLKRRTVLIDYPAQRLKLLDRAAQAADEVSSCRLRWRIPMRFLKGAEGFPLIPGLRIGDTRAVATLDTGSDGTVILYPSNLEGPGVRAALVPAGETTSSGFNGADKRTRWTLNASIGFGPFRLPPGVVVELSNQKGSAATSLANVGNRIYAALKLKLLLDYRDRVIGFYGSCA